jgi:hypothetical protein
MSTNASKRHNFIIRHTFAVIAFVYLGAFVLMYSRKADPSMVFAAPQGKSTAEQGVPAYHERSPFAESDLPLVTDAKQFDQPVVQNAYRLAKGLTRVLYQQPCYCYCDRHHGHTSLLDCYTSKHASECGTCLKELFYVHKQTSRDQTPEAIRIGIIRGDWKTLDIKRYETPLVAGH